MEAGSLDYLLRLAHNELGADAIILSLPALILSLGLFYFVLNALLLWGFSKLLPGYTVAGFWSALFGSLVLMLVNWVLHALFRGQKKEERA